MFAEDPYYDVPSFVVPHVQRLALFDVAKANKGDELLYIELRFNKVIRSQRDKEGRYSDFAACLDMSYSHRKFYVSKAAKTKIVCYATGEETAVTHLEMKRGIPSIVMEDLPLDASFKIRIIAKSIEANAPVVLQLRDCIRKRRGLLQLMNVKTAQSLIKHEGAVDALLMVLGQFSENNAS